MVTEEKMQEIVFEIITYAGMAKGMGYDAMNKAIDNNFDEAEKLLKEANQTLLKAHNIQTDIIHAEARGEKYPVSVLFVHAQDHLMTSIEVISLAETIIKLNKKIAKLENKE